MSKETVLVTGGAGYIGSHVCQALSKAGWTPVVYDNLSNGHKWAVKWGPFVEGDIHHLAVLEETIKTYQVSAVIHLASYIDCRESLKEPGKYYTTNVSGTLGLLEMMCKHSIPYFVFSSTAAIYGSPAYLPIDEKHPKAPLNPYGKSKLIIEEMLADFEKSHGLFSAALRYFNAAGADLEVQIGEAHRPETHLIPLAIQTAFGKKPHFTLYGNDFPTPDGTAVRDYIHVADLADAHVKALNALMTKKTSIAVNLGTGQGYSVQEILNAVQKFTKTRIQIQIHPRSASDSAALVANCRRAGEILNWKPKYSDLETIISTACEWHRSQLE